MPPKASARSKQTVSNQQTLTEFPPPGLFYDFLSQPSSVNEIFERWSHEYEKKPEAALVKLLNFLIHASGCSYTLTEATSDIDNEQAQHLLRYFERNGSYPITNKHIWKADVARNFEKIPKILCQQLVRTGAMFDNSMDPFVTWVGTLSGSRIRPFRHTISIFGLHFISALISLYLDLQTEYEENQKMLQAEEQGKKKQSARAKHLQKVTAELKERYDYVHDLVEKTLFRQIFQNRYRDTLPQLRCLCMKMLGEWSLLDPKLFLSHNYTKHFAWMLNDKNANVRAETLRALIPIFQSPQLFPSMKLFWAYFRDRLVDLTDDIDETPATLAVQLLQCVLKQAPENLTEQYIEAILNQLLHLTSFAVRAAAARFLSLYLQKRYADLIETDKTEYSSACLRYICNFILTKAKTNNRREEITMNILYASKGTDLERVLMNWDAYERLLMGTEEIQSSAKKQKGKKAAAQPKAKAKAKETQKGKGRKHDEEEDDAPDQSEPLTEDEAFYLLLLLSFSATVNCIYPLTTLSDDPLPKKKGPKIVDDDDESEGEAEKKPARKPQGASKQIDAKLSAFTANMSKESAKLIKQMHPITMNLGERDGSLDALSRMVIGCAGDFFTKYSENTRCVLLFIDLLPRMRWTALSLDNLQRSVPELLRVLPSLFTQHHEAAVLDSIAASLSLLLSTPHADPAQAEKAIADLLESLTTSCSDLIDTVKEQWKEDGPTDEDVDDDDNDPEDLADYRLVPRWNESNRLKEIGYAGKASTTLAELRLHVKRLAHLLAFVPPLSLTQTQLSLFLSLLQAAADGAFPLHATVLRHAIRCQTLLLHRVQNERMEQNQQARLEKELEDDMPVAEKSRSKKGSKKDKKTTTTTTSSSSSTIDYQETLTETFAALLKLSRCTSQCVCEHAVIAARDLIFSFSPLHTATALLGDGASDGPGPLVIEPTLEQIESITEAMMTAVPLIYSQHSFINNLIQQLAIQLEEEEADKEESSSEEEQTKKPKKSKAPKRKIANDDDEEEEEDEEDESEPDAAGDDAAILGKQKAVKKTLTRHGNAASQRFEDAHDEDSDDSALSLDEHNQPITRKPGSAFSRKPRAQKKKEPIAFPDKRIFHLTIQKTQRHKKRQGQELTSFCEQQKRLFLASPDLIASALPLTITGAPSKQSDFSAAAAFAGPQDSEEKKSLLMPFVSIINHYLDGPVTFHGVTSTVAQTDIVQQTTKLLTTLISSPVFTFLSRLRLHLRSRLERLIRSVTDLLWLFPESDSAILFIFSPLLVGFGGNLSRLAIELLATARDVQDEKQRGVEQSSTAEPSSSSSSSDADKNKAKESWRVDALLIRQLIDVFVPLPQSKKAGQSDSATTTTSSSSSTASPYANLPRSASLLYALAIVRQICLTYQPRFMKHPELVKVSQYLIEWGVTDVSTRAHIFPCLTQISFHLQLSEKFLLLEFLINVTRHLSKTMMQEDPEPYQYLVQYFDALKRDVTEKKSTAKSALSKPPPEVTRAATEVRLADEEQDKEEDAEEEEEEPASKKKAAPKKPAQTKPKVQPKPKAKASEEEKGKKGKKQVVEEEETTSDDDDDDDDDDKPVKRKAVPKKAPKKKGKKDEYLVLKSVDGDDEEEDDTQQTQQSPGGSLFDDHRLA